MTVLKISKNKIKIALSDSEVLSYFGSYQKITSMSKSIRIMISSVLEECLADYGFDQSNDKFLIELRIKENYGCEIIITVISKRESLHHPTIKNYTLEFADSESMTGGIMYLYRNRKYRYVTSNLYKMTETYRLILQLSSGKDIPFSLNEFCIRKSDSPFEIAYTEEYGKLLIADNAIEKFGKAFSKSF